MVKFRRNSIIPGFIVITIGVLFLLQNTGFELGFKISDLWPSVFIFIGLWKLFNFRGKSIISGLIFLLIGIFLIAKNFGYIDYGFEIIWPVLLIIAGIGIFFSSTCNNKNNKSSDKTLFNVDDDLINLSLSLCGNSYTYNSANFKGGAVSLTMGACDIDLRKIDLNSETVTIEVSLIMGEINIFVPSNWKAVIQVSPTLAEVKDLTRFTEINDKKSKNIIIKGSAVLGEVNIKN